MRTIWSARFGWKETFAALLYLANIGMLAFVIWYYFVSLVREENEAERIVIMGFTPFVLLVQLLLLYIPIARWQSIDRRPAGPLLVLPFLNLLLTVLSLCWINLFFF